MSDSSHLAPGPQDGAPQRDRGDAIARFVLRSTRGVRLGGWTVSLLILSAIVAELGGRSLEERFGVLSELVPIFFVALALVPVGWRLIVRRSDSLVIELGPDTLSLPRALDDGRTERVPLSEVEAVFIRGRIPRGFVYIQSRRRSFSFPLSRFGDPVEGTALAELVRAGIAALPDGAERIRRMDARLVASTAALENRCPVTLAMIAVMLVLGAVVQWVGGSDLFSLLRFGANAPVLVFDGQWYRLLSASFLHSGLMHIGMNLYALGTLGAILERLLGSWRFLAVYLVAAFTGTLASALLPRAAVSMGSSTAVFGLLGALAFLTIRFRDVMPAGFQTSRGSWIFVVAANALLPVFVPQIDVLAHVGGVVGGVAAVAILTAGRRELPIFGVGAGLRACVLALAGLFAFGLASAVVHASRPDPADELAVVRDYGSRLGELRAALNDYAWAVATSPDPELHRLEVAERAASLALEAKGSIESRLAVEDTLATIVFLRGDADRALALEADLLRAVDDRRFARQFLRFFGDRTAPLRLTEEGGSIEVAFDGGRSHVDLSRAEVPAGAMTVYLVVRSAGRPFALLAYTLEPDDGREVRREARPERVGEERWPDDATVHVALVRAGREPERAWPGVGPLP